MPETSTNLYILRVMRSVDHPVFFSQGRTRGGNTLAVLDDGFGENCRESCALAGSRDRLSTWRCFTVGRLAFVPGRKQEKPCHAGSSPNVLGQDNVTCHAADIQVKGVTAPAD